MSIKPRHFSNNLLAIFVGGLYLCAAKLTNAVLEKNMEFELKLGTVVPIVLKPIFDLIKNLDYISVYIDHNDNVEIDYHALYDSRFELSRCEGYLLASEYCQKYFDSDVEGFTEWVIHSGVVPNMRICGYKSFDIDKSWKCG